MLNIQCLGMNHFPLLTLRLLLESEEPLDCTLQWSIKKVILLFLFCPCFEKHCNFLDTISDCGIIRDDATKSIPLTVPTILNVNY